MAAVPPLTLPNDEPVSPVATTKKKKKGKLGKTGKGQRQDSEQGNLDAVYEGRVAELPPDPVLTKPKTAELDPPERQPSPDALDELDDIFGASPITDKGLGKLPDLDEGPKKTSDLPPLGGTTHGLPPVRGGASLAPIGGGEKKKNNNGWGDDFDFDSGFDDFGL